MIKLKPNPRFIRRPEGRGRKRRSPTRICSRNQKTRTSRTVCEKYGEETADKRGSQRWWWKGDRRRDGKAVRREDGRQVDRKKTTEEADRGDGSQRSERWSKGYKTRHAEAMKRADQRRAKRPRCETTEADPKKPTGDVHRDYKAVLLAMVRDIGVGEVRKQLEEVEMGYNPAKEKRQDDASRELSRSKEKRQEEANAIEGREENDPPEQELTETETAYEVSEPPEASNTKELANIEAAARLRVPVQQDNGNGRVGIGMPLYLVGASKELRENAEKRESDLKNKENDEKQEEKRNKHAAEVKARAARAMEKHVTTSPPKSAASEQGCRCDEPPRSSWGKRKWQGGEQEWKKESPRSRKWQGETGNGDEDFAQPTWKKQSWRQSEEKIDDHHAGSSKKKWSVDKEKEYQEQSQSSWDKERQPDEEDTDSKIKDQPNWNEKEGWREEDWREGKEKGDEESSQLKWKKESWKDVRENGGQDSSKQRWSKGGERGESERGGDEISQPLPAGFIPPPPPPSPSVPPTPSSPLSTARGSVGRSFQSDAAVVKANDNGIRDTVLKRVGPTRQEQSRKTDTNVAVLNQMLTDLRINSNYRKIPAGCIEGTSGMSHDSARIVKVDFENDMRGLSQLHHYMYTRPHSARVFRL